MFTNIALAKYLRLGSLGTVGKRFSGLWTLGSPKARHLNRTALVVSYGAAATSFGEDDTALHRH